jgi:hypothetical protein
MFAFKSPVNSWKIYTQCTALNYKNFAFAEFLSDFISTLYIRGKSIFGFDFLAFQYLTTEFGSAKNSETKVEKALFVIFMSSCPEMGFWAKKRENSLKRVELFFSSNGSI